MSLKKLTSSWTTIFSLWHPHIFLKSNIYFPQKIKTIPKLQNIISEYLRAPAHSPSHLPSLARHPHSGAGPTWKSPAMGPPSIDAQRRSRVKCPTAATEMHIWANVPTCKHEKWCFNNVKHQWENEGGSTGKSMFIDVIPSVSVSGKPAEGTMFFRQNKSFLLTFHLVQSDKNCLKIDLLGIFAGNHVICLQPFPSSNSEMHICFKRMDTWHLRSNKINKVHAFLGVHQQRPHKKMISKTQQNPKENYGLNEEKWMESMFLSNTSGLIIQPKIDAKRLQTWKCWEKLSTTSLRRSACEEYRWKNEQIYSYRQYASIFLRAANI